MQDSDRCTSHGCTAEAPHCCGNCGRARCGDHAIRSLSVGEVFCWGDTLTDAQLQGGETYCEEPHP